MSDVSTIKVTRKLGVLQKLLVFDVLLESLFIKKIVSYAFLVLLSRLPCRRGDTQLEIMRVVLNDLSNKRTLATSRRTCNYEGFHFVYNFLFLKPHKIFVCKLVNNLGFVKEKFGHEVDEDFSDFGFSFEVFDLLLFDLFMHDSVVEFQFGVELF